MNLIFLRTASGLFSLFGVVGLQALLSPPVLAQTTEPSNIPTPSYFSGYKPQQEVKVGNWREANDEVGRIGGWRVYTREAAEAIEADKKREEAEKAKGKTQTKPQGQSSRTDTPTDTSKQGGHSHGHRH